MQKTGAGGAYQGDATLPASDLERSKDPIQLGFSSLKWLIIATPNREKMLRAIRCTSPAESGRRC
jgi:hypothetical protein